MATKSSAPPAKSPAVPKQNANPRPVDNNSTKGEKKEKDEVEKVVESFFTPVLEKLINDITPMVDPLDMQTFNSVEYVNMLFPNGL